MAKSLKTMCFLVFDHHRNLFFDRDGPFPNKKLNVDSQRATTIGFYAVPLISKKRIPFWGTPSYND